MCLKGRYIHNAVSRSSVYVVHTSEKLLNRFNSKKLRMFTKFSLLREVVYKFLVILKSPKKHFIACTIRMLLVAVS